MAGYIKTDFLSVCEDFQAHGPPVAAYAFFKTKLKSMRSAWAHALVKSTLKAVRCKGLFEVWDDNLSSAYTAHAHSMRQNLRKLCQDYLADGGMQDQRKVCQLVAVLISLYAGGITVSDSWLAGRNKKLHRTLLIGAYNFVLNAINALNRQQNDWGSAASMHSLAAEESGDMDLMAGYDSDAESKPPVPTSSNMQAPNQSTVAGFIASKKAASTKAPQVDGNPVIVKSEGTEHGNCSHSRLNRFDYMTFTKERYFGLLQPAVRKAEDDAACQHLKLTGREISTAVYEAFLDVFGSKDKKHVILLDGNPDLLIFKDEGEKYYTLLTANEADALSAWDNQENGGDMSQHSTTLKTIEQLLSTATSIAKAGGNVMILLVYDWRSIHQVLVQITATNNTCTKSQRVQADVRVYDSLPAQHDTLDRKSLEDDLQQDVAKWRDWLDSKNIGLDLELTGGWYQALGQHVCSWRCGYFVAMNVRYLLEGKEPPRDCEGALDAAVIDMYASLVKHSVARGRR